MASAFWSGTTTEFTGLGKMAGYVPDPTIDAKFKEIFEKDPFATIGCLVGLIGSPYTGTIKAVAPNGRYDSAVFTVDAPGVQIYRLTHGEFVLLNTPEKPKTRRQVQKETLTGIVNNINTLRKRYKQNLENAIVSQENQIKNYENNIKVAKHKLEEYNLLAKENIKTESATSIKELLVKMKRHPYITDAYIGQNGRLIFLTKALQRDTGKKFLKGSIGRFEIQISMQHGEVKIFNLDFIYEGKYNHPNILNGEMCWGDNQSEVNEMLYQAKIEEFIEFTLICLTAYPQDEGTNPYVNPDDWYEGKEKIDGKSEPKL